MTFAVIYCTHVRLLSSCTTFLGDKSDKFTTPLYSDGGSEINPKRRGDMLKLTLQHKLFWIFKSGILNPKGLNEKCDLTVFLTTAFVYSFMYFCIHFVLYTCSICWMQCMLFFCCRMSLQVIRSTFPFKKTLFASSRTTICLFDWTLLVVGWQFVFCNP